MKRESKKEAKYKELYDSAKKEIYNYHEQIALLSKKAHEIALESEEWKSKYTALLEKHIKMLESFEEHLNQKIRPSCRNDEKEQNK